MGRYSGPFHKLKVYIDLLGMDIDGTRCHWACLCLFQGSPQAQRDRVKKHQPIENKR